MSDSIIKKAITDKLGRDDKDKHRFYVYALCEESNGTYIPFYIGKGQGDRVWQHEEEADKLFNEFIEYAEKEKIDVSSERKQRFTKKHAEIKKLRDNGKYKRLIIKWGLTEDEAFMVESALINFIGFDKLTNLVNGHASEKEKNSNIPTTNSNAHKTQAMTTDDFYNMCCKANIVFENIKEKWLFINIHEFYRRIDPTDQEQIRHAALGYWDVDCSPEIGDDKYPAYMFVLYQSRILGIFQLEKCIKVCDMKEEDKDYCPKYPVKERKEDIQRIKNNEPKIKKKAFLVCKTIDEKHELFEGVFVGDLLNRLLLTKEEKSIFPPQGSVRYPSIRIYNQAKVNKTKLKKELLKYFLKVEIENLSEAELIEKVKAKGYSEDKEEKEIAKIKAVDYTIEKKEDFGTLAKNIYDKITDDNRKELLKRIKDN